MSNLVMSLIIFVSSGAAGFLGSLTGLGGGIVIIPLLTIGLGVDIRYAIGASLVSVIATSSGAAAAYVKEGFSNIRIGMFLEIATTLGAISGAFIALVVAPGIIAIVFGIVLLLSALTMFQKHAQDGDGVKPDFIASKLRLNGTYPTPEGEKAYNVRSVPAGFGLMAIAGALSGLLGIGSGALKVIAMDRLMKMPFKVSTTTSNFMIGVTAAASAGIYLSRGYIDPGLSMPVVLGVLLGSMLGSRVLRKAETKLLRIVFALTIVFLGAQMIYKGIVGGF
jgi:uncharacterized protein